MAWNGNRCLWHVTLSLSYFPITWMVGIYHIRTPKWDSIILIYNTMLMMMVLAQLYYDCNMTKTKPSSFRIASFSVVIVINTKPSTIFFCTIAHPSNCLTLYDCMHIENYIADSLSLSVSFCARCILFYLCLMCMVSLTKQKVIRCMQWFLFFHLMLNA